MDNQYTLYLSQLYRNYLNQNLSFEERRDQAEIKSTQSTIIDSIAKDLFKLSAIKTTDVTVINQSHNYKIILNNSETIKIFKEYIASKYKEITAEREISSTSHLEISVARLIRFCPQLQGKVREVIKDESQINIYGNNDREIEDILRRELRPQDPSCIWGDVELDPVTKQRIYYIAITAQLWEEKIS